MGYAVQPGRPRGVEVWLELRSRHPDLRAAEAEGDQALGPVVQGVVEGGVGRRQAELPGDVVDPAEHQPEVALHCDARVLQRLGVGLDRHADAVVVRADGGVRRARQLGVAQLLPHRHLAGHLISEVADVLRRADQRDHREVDLDEVGEVAELVEAL
jgi:hypothetical protein